MASGKATTRKLSGRAKDNFFDAGLAPDEAKAAVTSLQVRKEAWPVSKDLRSKARTSEPQPAPEKPSRPARSQNPQKLASPPAVDASPPPTQTKPPPQPGTATPKFDPFVFGLVPVYKREGADGLAARLNEIGDVENLREMAKAQQIILPRDVRRGDASIETVRSAVLAAVEQRVSDRKVQL